MANEKGNTTGAGRPEGSMNVPKFSSYFSAEEIEQFAIDMKERAKNNDRIAIFVD